MEKEFVPYELAVKLKELGFGEECFTIYFKSGIIKQTELSAIIGYLPIDITHKESCLAPLWQQAFDWFREDHRIDCCISKSFECYNINIVKTNEEQENEDLSEGLNWKDFEYYTQARHECLEKLIELVTNQNNQSNERV